MTNSIVFKSGGQTTITINSNGNLGLGTVSPSYSYKWKQEEEPLTKWYKEAVKARGLTPHEKEKDIASQKVKPLSIEEWKKINGSET